MSKVRGYDVGMTTGIGVQASWVQIFYHNANCPPAQRLSDPDITEWMNKEFPLRKSRVYKKVNSVRRAFNRRDGYQGKWLNALREASIPEFFSDRYDDKGNEI